MNIDELKRARYMADGWMSVQQINTIAEKWERLAKLAMDHRDEIIESGQQAHAAEEVLAERASVYRKCAADLHRFARQYPESGAKGAAG